MISRIVKVSVTLTVEANYSKFVFYIFFPRLLLDSQPTGVSDCHKSCSPEWLPNFDDKGVSAEIESFSYSVSLKFYFLFKDCDSLAFRCSSVDRRVYIAIRGG